MPFTPPVSCKLWLKPDGLSAGALATWSDSSGHGNDATMTGATVVAGAVNGLPAVHGDGSTTSGLLTSPIALGADFAVFIVQQTSGDRILLGKSDDTTQFRIGTSSANIITFYDNISLRNSSALATSRSSFSLVEFLRTSGTVSLFETGNAIGTASDAGTAAVDAIGHTLPPDGYLVEIMVCDAAIDTATRQGIENYLVAKCTLSGAPASTATIPVSESHFAAGFSPYTWFLGGSDYADTNNPGADLTLRLVSPTGTDAVLGIDTSLLAGASSGSYPKLRFRAGDAAWTSTQLTSGQTTLTIAAGLAAGTHDLHVQFVSGDYTVNRWDPGTTPYMSLRITGLTVTSDCTLADPPVPSGGALLVLSDSIGEGLNLTAEVANGGDAFLAFGRYYAAANNYRRGNVCFGGVGLVKDATSFGGVPAVWNPNDATKRSWSLYHAAASRLVSGLLSPAAAEILVVLATNDALGGVSDADAQAGLQGLIGALRTAAPGARITIAVPFGGYKRSAINAGFTAASDGNSGLIDLGTAFQVGLDGSLSPSFSSIDGIHPNDPTQAEAAARMVAATAGGGPGAYTAAANVRSGTDRGDGTTGTLVVPAASHVTIGTTYDNGTAGTVTLPIVGDVEAGVTFGAALGSTGTFAVPSAGNVRSGTGYGAGGSEFTGTLTVPTPSPTPTRRADPSRVTVRDPS